MVVIQLMGGIGNQMFQYSAGRALSLRTNSDLYYDFDDTYKLAQRKLRLDAFNVVALESTVKDLSKVKPAKGIARLFRKLIGNEDRFLFQEKAYYQFDPEFRKVEVPVYLRGFWQNVRYFDEIREILLQDFTLRSVSEEMKRALEVIGDGQDAVSVHIRRGDYTNSKSGFSVLPLDYYTMALQRVDAFNKRVFFFTDDPDWVREHFTIAGAMIISSKFKLHDAEEIILMSKCKVNIIANSSFSWWGAWLNNDPAKVVIYPNHWLPDGRSLATELMPTEWISI